MAKCTEDWDNCSGFFGCIGPAISTAAKCTASYLEDKTSQSAQFHRSAMYNAVKCSFDKYLAGQLTATELSKALGGYTNPIAQVYHEESVGLENWVFQGSKAFPDKWLFKAPPTKIVSQTREFYLHKAGQASPPNHSFTVVEQGVWANLPVIGDMFVQESKLFTQERFSKGPCPQFGQDDKTATVKKMLWSYFSAVATLGGGDLQTAYKAIKAVTAGKPEGIVMEALFSVLQDYGIEVPQEVKDFLTCLYGKAGSLVFTAVKQAVIDGDPKGAGQLLAPYAVDCGANTLKKSLGDGSPWSPLIDAIVLAAVVAAAPPPPPKPKVPVTDPKLECNKSGGIYFETTGECYPFQLAIGASKASEKAIELVQKVTPQTVAAATVQRQNQEQQQLLLLAGVAVVAYLALS